MTLCPPQPHFPLTCCLGIEACANSPMSPPLPLRAVSNASRTMMMDLSTFQWHAPFLQLFNMPLDALPRIVSNAEIYGHVAEGPLTGVPISGCLGDQMAAVLGEGGPHRKATDRDPGGLA